MSKVHNAYYVALMTFCLAFLFLACWLARTFNVEPFKKVIYLEDTTDGE